MALANGVRGMRFERSGGLLFLVLGGEVALDGPAPGILTEVGNRAVSDDDRAVFAAVDVAKARTAPMPLTQTGPESYQWDVTLLLADGSTVALRWHAHTVIDPHAEAAIPGITGLAIWLGKEVDRIWARKADAPSP